MAAGACGWCKGQASRSTWWLGLPLQSELRQAGPPGPLAAGRILWLRFTPWSVSLVRPGGERLNSKWPSAATRQEFLIIMVGGLIALAPFALMGLFLGF